MIAFVRGTAVDMTENSVIVETGGIGYEIYTEIDALYPGFTIRFVESIEKQRRYMKEFG